MSQLHVHAEPGQVAPFVLLPGDPGRARFIAEAFLDDARLYSENRGLLGFSGRYRGVPVSVQTTGMGCPSLAIVAEELIRLGARTLVRVGTAGIIGDAVRPGDLVVADAAVPMDGTTRAYLGGEPAAPAPSFAVTRALVAAAEADGAGESGGTGNRGGAGEAGGSGAARAPHVGTILTEDAFYATRPEDVARHAERGLLAVEMEAAALFLLGRLRRVETGCLLVASNHVGDPQFVAPEILRAGVERMVRTALDAAVSLHASAGA